MNISKCETPEAVLIICNKTTSGVKSSSIVQKRPRFPDDRLLYTSNKRRVANTPLYSDQYHDICLGMSDLSHQKIYEIPSSQFDAVLEAFVELNVNEQINWRRPMEELLDVEWFAAFSSPHRVCTSIQRAIRLCKSCGIVTFRDVLWYNRTLKRAAGLKRFPICLVDMAFNLTDWQPRKLQPSATIGMWRDAWQALAQVWPSICLELPHELKRRLLNRKFEEPPATANWFEFNFFDGVYSHMEPLLCYHEDEHDALPTS